MEKKPKNSGKKRRICLMAYTLNNTQPVLCTLVADQPYFFMDEENIPSDEDTLGLEEFEHFEEDLALLKKKMEAYERLSKSYTAEPTRRMEEFMADAVNITEIGTSDFATIEMLEAAIRQSRMAETLLDFAKNHNVTVEFSKQVDGAQYDPSAKKILVHPGLGSEEQVLLGVRELRRHWQHRKGALIHPLTFHPDHAILVNRAQNADLSIAMVRAAWEMQLAGHKDAWNFIEQSAMADLGRAFAREAFVDFRSIANGKASAAAFETWFLSERCRHQDKHLIQAMLADQQGYVFTGETASRHISIELVTALGEQPFGKNYLAPFARMIMEDPIFIEVRDRSNANFLWFIKFERSFRETEQALQGGEGHIGESSFSDPANPFHSGLFKHESESRIVSLKTKIMVEDTTENGANIIHVRFGEGKNA